MAVKYGEFQFPGDKGFTGSAGKTMVKAYARGGAVMKAKGGKLSMEEWEHSKKDLAEDKKLAKKHGMSLAAWEKSEADKKHDTQQSMKGLKKGGAAKMARGGRSCG